LILRYLLPIIVSVNLSSKLRNLLN